MPEIRVVNTILYCRKWKETVDFYMTGLKLEQTASFGWLVEFRLNETSRLSVADEARSSIKSGGGKGLTITMMVDDIEETFVRLKTAGLEPPAPKEHPWGARVIRIRDPEGNRLEFWSQNRKDP